MKTVIITNGDIRDLQLCKKIALDSDFIIVVDGAFELVIQMGITPHAAIGDFDSISPEAAKKLEASNIPVIKFPADKDKTDTELAVDYAVEKGASEIILLGATGSRLDHSLSNINLMVSTTQKGIKCRIVDEYNDCYFVKDKINLRAKSNSYVSIIPLTREIVVGETQGLYYSLKEATMKFGSSWGVSNIATDQKITVTIKKGVALVVLSQDREGESHA